MSINFAACPNFLTLSATASGTLTAIMINSYTKVGNESGNLTNSYVWAKRTEIYPIHSYEQNKPIDLCIKKLYEIMFSKNW